MKPKFVKLAVLAVLCLCASPGSTQFAPATNPSLYTGVKAPVPSAAEIPVVLLIDLSTGQTLYSREAERRFIPASVTKVMTAYTAFRLVEEGKLSLGAQIPISKAVEEEWSGEGSSMFLLEGERPTVGDLLLGSTTVSGNDATVALAIGATGSVQNWVDAMNSNAAELGMKDSHFGSPNGFPDGGTTFTTARDLAKLGEAIITRYPGLYSRYFGHRQMTWRGKTQDNHDPLSGQVAGGDGLKTGFTSEAGFTFLGSAQRGNRRLIVVLAGSQTTQIRDEAARSLIEWGFARFTDSEILPRGLPIGQAMVQNGMKRSVQLRTPRAVMASVPVSGDANMKLWVQYRGPVMAPVLEGDPIARLRIEIAGMEPVEVPLEAATSVDKANFWQRLVNGLTGFFA